MSGIVTQLFPLFLPTILSRLPLPQKLRNPTSQRRLLILILSLYLLYSLAASVFKVFRQPTFYDVLSLPRNAGTTEVSQGWKAFARRNHPDRRGGEEGAEDVFRVGRVAYDTLNDDVRRWAYDRFGPDSTNWSKSCATQREFLLRGLYDSVGFYLVSFVVLFGMALLGTGAKETAFWRLLLLPTLLALELYLLLNPTPPTPSTPFPLVFLSLLLPQKTQHALILLLRNVGLSTTMFLNQVGPLVFSSATKEEGAREREKREEEEARLVARLGALVKVAEVEAARIYATELSPLLDPTPALADPVKTLYREMEEVLVDSRLKGHPAVGPVWDQAVRRTRGESAVEQVDDDEPEEEEGEEEGSD